MDVIKDTETERAFIGACIINPEIIGVAKLTEEAFIDTDLRDIWATMKKMWLKKMNIDYLTLSTGKPKERIILLTELINACPTHMGWETYEQRLITLQMRRRAIALAENMVNAVMRGDDLAIPLNAEKLMGLSVSRAESKTVGDVLSVLYDDIIERQAHYAAGREVPTGITTGLPKVDMVTGGLQPGQVILIGGEPGLGKSMLAMQMAKAAATQTAVRVYSLEMTAESVVRRWLAAESGIRTGAMKSGQIDQDFWQPLTDAVSRLSTLPITICDDASMTTSDIRADLVRNNKNGTGLVVIDYLALLQDGAGQEETDRTGTISLAVKRLARDMNVAVLLINSINKIGMRSGSEPNLADFRGSGQVVFDADIAMMMTRGTREYFPMASDEELENCRLLWIKKGRELETPENVFLLQKGVYKPEFHEWVRPSGIGFANGSKR